MKSTKQLCIGVIGLGIVGSATAELITKSGIRLIGCDKDKEKVSKFKKKCSDAIASTDYACLKDANIIFIAIRLYNKFSQDAQQSELFDLARNISEHSNNQVLLILETTVTVGTTRELENYFSSIKKSNIKIAYSPERLSVGESAESILQTPRLVGATTKHVVNEAVSILKKIGITCVQVKNPEVAELSKLIENAFISINIGLVGEVTRIAHSYSISATDVIAAAATKTKNYYPFWPGAGVGGHCLPNDLITLSVLADKNKIEAPILRNTKSSLNLMTFDIINFLKRKLIDNGKTLFNNTIWIIGVGFKVGSDDVTKSPAIEIIRALRSYDANVLFSHHRVDSLLVDQNPITKVINNKFPEAVDAILIVSGDKTIKLEELSKRSSILIDLGGGNIMHGRAQGIYKL